MISLTMAGGPEFAVALYRWALEEWAFEARRDFPLLRAVHNSYCIVTIQMLEKLPPEERLRMGHVLAKRSHPEAAKVLGDPLNSEETEYLGRLNIERSTAVNVLEFPRTSALIAGVKGPPRVPLSAIKKAVREAIEPTLGGDREAISGRNWEYHTPIGRWTVDTDIEFFSSNIDVSYQHDIRTSDGQWCLASMLSIPGSLGVTAGWWCDLTVADIPVAAAGLTFVCKRFMDALPNLLPE